MNKIFVLSLHRTGTQSVHDLFIRLGLSAVHWPAVVDGIDYQSQVIGREDDLGFVADLLTPVFEQVTAVSDVPVPVLYRELEAQYDNARFIAIRRKPHEWLQSVRRHIGDRALDPYEKVQYFRYLPDRHDRISCVSDDDLIAMHRNHYEALHSHFSGKSNFALFELDEPNLGERICTYLGMPPLELELIDPRYGRPGIVIELESLKNSRSKLFRQFCRQLVRKRANGAGHRSPIVAEFETLQNSPSQLFRQLCRQIIGKAIRRVAQPKRSQPF